MARYFNLESGLLLVVLLAVAAGVAVALGLDWPKALALGLAVAMLTGFPLAAALQDKLLEVYAKRGKLDRALDLAIAIRNSAPNGRLRNRAQVDLALLQLLRRDYEHALANLSAVKQALVSSDPARAVVRGHMAYCLAHLSRELPRAEELARDAVKAAPDEPIFAYFLGLTLLQQGRAAEAEPLIAESLEKNPDAAEPFPGERHWALARARAELGQDAEPARSQAIAAGGHFAEQARSLGASAAS